VPDVAALLLTGGASRRMGTDKASLIVDGERLADRAARLLQRVADPVLEVGPGFSGLACVREDEPGLGPLAAVGLGGAALLAGGVPVPVIVLAVDMPRVAVPLLDLLARHPSEDSVVPADPEGQLQPLCARYSAAALTRAAELVADGARSMHALLDAIPLTVLTADEWTAVAPADAFADLDTPADLERL
jgi:molybdopterin-guanine dinucleotide biosynthesis protein A